MDVNIDNSDNENDNSDALVANEKISSTSTIDDEALVSGLDEKDTIPETKRKIHKLSLKTTTNFNEILRNRGVLYIARIPPRMSPAKIKLLLSDFGEVTRIFLQEEDPSARKRRKKNGGTGTKRYIEGWVEMESKSLAKHVAQSLHMTPISNQKRNPHCDDLWSLKYLSKFKWSHLTEKVAYERRVREQKLRLETLQARRETSEYKKLVEDGKKLDKIEERRRKRQPDSENQGNERKQPRQHQLKPVENGLDKSMKHELLNSLAT